MSSVIITSAPPIVHQTAGKFAHARQCEPSQGERYTKFQSHSGSFSEKFSVFFAVQIIPLKLRTCNEVERDIGNLSLIISVDSEKYNRCILCRTQACIGNRTKITVRRLRVKSKFSCINQKLYFFPISSPACQIPRGLLICSYSSPLRCR